MEDPALVERRGATTILTINRPHRRNAYDSTVIEALQEAMAAFDADPDLHVGILTGAGDLAFCSGSDLTEQRPPSRRRGPLEHVEMFGVGASPKPMIAAVNGLAVGGGVELALNCDVRIAAEDAWVRALRTQAGHPARCRRAPVAADDLLRRRGVDAPHR